MSMREVVQDGFFWLGEEDPEGRGLEFNSVCVGMNTVVLQVG